MKYENGVQILIKKNLRAIKTFRNLQISQKMLKSLEIF